MHTNGRWESALRAGTLVLATIGALLPAAVRAASGQEIDIRADAAMKGFYAEVDGARDFVRHAKGVLVFPRVVKAGFGIGGEYGEGALRIRGKTVAYYSTAAASIGLQIGAQSKTVVLVFLKQKALDAFRASQGWKAGVDGSVALIDTGTGGAIDTDSIRDPIVGFVLGNKGLMLNVTLEGSKFTRIEK